MEGRGEESEQVRLLYISSTDADEGVHCDDTRARFGQDMMQSEFMHIEVELHRKTDTAYVCVENLG